MMNLVKDGKEEVDVLVRTRLPLWRKTSTTNGTAKFEKIVWRGYATKETPL